MANANLACTGILIFMVIILAGAVIGSYIYTAHVDDDLDSVEKTAKNAKNAVNPVTVPEDYARNNVHPNEDDDDDGSNSDDDDDDNDHDSAQKDPTVVGEFVVADLVDKHNNLIRPGHADFLVPTTIYDKNLTITGDGSLVTSLESVIRSDFVCADELSGIERGDVIGYDGTCIRKGFTTNQQWPVGEGFRPYGLYKFDMGNNRTGVLYENANDELAMLIETSNEDTGIVEKTTEAVISATGFAFARDCGRVAAAYPGAPDHFVVAWEEEASANGILAATCRIDSMLPLMLTCTAAPPQLNAGISSVPIALEHIGVGTEFALTYADATNGLSVVTISSVSATLATTFNAPLVLDAAVQSAGGSACRSYDSFVRGSQVVTVYVDDASSTPFSMQIANLVGTSFVSAGPATVLSSDTDGFVQVEAIGASQAVIGFNPRGGSFLLSLGVVTLTQTGPDLSSLTDYALSLGGDLAPNTNRAFISLTAIDENLVGMVYLTTRLSYTEVAQVAELYFDGASPRLSLGDVESFSHAPTERATCAVIAGSSVPSFSCSFAERNGIADTRYATKTIIARAGEFTSNVNGRDVHLVHNRPHVPTGIATSAAAAGEAVNFLTRGDFDDGSIINSDLYGPECSQRDVCLHCDGSLRSSSVPDDFYTCTPYCSCVITGSTSMNCRDIYHTRHVAVNY